MLVAKNVSVHDLREKGLDIKVKEVEPSVYEIEKASYQGKILSSKELDSVMRALGINPKRGYRATEKLNHVAEDGSHVYDHMITGDERIDKDWVRSGKCSDEAFFASSKMKGMIDQVRILRAGGDRK